MALATRCPYCHTTFRVAQDQLKLRAGLVRCGHCKEIFNGIEHLLPPDVQKDHAAPAAATAPSFAQPVRPAAQTSPVPSSSDASAELPDPQAETMSATPLTPDTVPVSTDVRPSHDPGASQTAVPAPSHSTDPLQRMTLLDFAHEMPEASRTEDASTTVVDAGMRASEQPDELEEALKELENSPWRRDDDEPPSDGGDARADALDQMDREEDEPGFVRRGRRRQKLSRTFRLVFGIGSAVLLATALLQGAYAFRDQLAANFPQTKPLLAQICNLAGCRIDLPAQISSVSLESTELQALAAAKDRFVLTVLLRNYSKTAQEWPYIELTLNDAAEKPLLRRVFTPADYLFKPDVALGFPADSERTVKLTFALSQIQASGYRVYLFYP